MDDGHVIVNGTLSSRGVKKHERGRCARRAIVPVDAIVARMAVLGSRRSEDVTCLAVLESMQPDSLQQSRHSPRKWPKEGPVFSTTASDQPNREARYTCTYKMSKEFNAGIGDLGTGPHDGLPCA